MSTWGERLKSCRERLQLTQQQAATRLGVRTATIGDWESQRVEPRWTSIVRFADEFDVSLDWLAGRRRRRKAA